MASQPAVKRESVRSARVPVQAPPKAKPFDYARFRVQLNKPDQFQQYLSGYPNKSGLRLYVYRLKPKIDFSLIQQREHTIRQIFELSDMTVDYVGREFGSGKYQFKLNDKLREKGETEVCSLVFEIEDPERPPVYDVRTLCLGNVENIDEINRLIEKGVLIRDANNMPRLRTERDGPAQTQAAPVAVAGSPELISRDVLGQVFLNLVKSGQQSPADAVKQSIEIARMLRPEGAAGSGLTVEQVLELIDRRLGKTSDLDPFSQWERIENFLAKARGGAAAVVSAATSDSTLAGISDVLKSAAVVIPQVIQGIDFLQKQRMRLAVTVNAHGTAPAPVAVDNGHGAQPMSLADRIGEVCQLGFIKMGEGINGYDYAAYVCNFHEGGLEVYRWLDSRGTAGVLGLLVMNEQAKGILTDPVQRQQLEVFLNDFFTYDPTGEGDEGDEDAPPVDGRAASAA